MSINPVQPPERETRKNTSELNDGNGNGLLLSNGSELPCQNADEGKQEIGHPELLAPHTLGPTVPPGNITATPGLHTATPSGHDDLELGDIARRHYQEHGDSEMNLDGADTTLSRMEDMDSGSPATGRTVELGVDSVHRASHYCSASDTGIEPESDTSSVPPVTQLASVIQEKGLNLSNNMMRYLESRSTTAIDNLVECALQRLDNEVQIRSEELGTNHYLDTNSSNAGLATVQADNTNTQPRRTTTKGLQSRGTLKIVSLNMNGRNGRPSAQAKEAQHWKV
jgi:hypothetical protein